MNQKFDIRSEPERALHRAAYDIAHLGETPERAAALERALSNSAVTPDRRAQVYERARLCGAEQRERER